MSDPISNSTHILAPNTATSLPYAARCSIPLSAALAVIVSNDDNPAAPNPFRCNFIERLSTVAENVRPGVKVLGPDPRTYSYLALAIYRLLRHLIPHTDAVVAAAQLSSADAPPSSPATTQVALAAMRARVSELMIGELQEHVI